MKITFVQTGGTIDKDYPKHTNGWAFEIDTPAVERLLPKLNATFDCDVVRALQKDSTEITDVDRANLVKLCLHSDACGDKIVLTHGTDTMRDTVQCLAQASTTDDSGQSRPTKTIVVTGAMRPERFSNTDADLNVGMAIATVQIAPPGVYLCMHGRVIPSHQIGRDLETGQYYIEGDTV